MFTRCLRTAGEDALRCGISHRELWFWLPHNTPPPHTHTKSFSWRTLTMWCCGDSAVTERLPSCFNCLFSVLQHRCLFWCRTIMTKMSAKEVERRITNSKNSTSPLKFLTMHPCIVTYSDKVKITWIKAMTGKCHFFFLESMYFTNSDSQKVVSLSLLFWSHT